MIDLEDSNSSPCVADTRDALITNNRSNHPSPTDAKSTNYDIFHQNLSANPDKNGPHVSWQLRKNLVEIEYDIQVAFLDKALAIAKLEYDVRPIFERLSAVSGPSNLFSDTEKAFAYALLCCAVLTRVFSTEADCWFLNLAVGVRLLV
ncbi:uncharacterized protein EAF01_004255 [Botrytis porri]|uniref:uncharacterized protein n=1 Tax=Botrytis porri TaxID=87229 RepID=UPI00190299F2|nr:uncharacterized protein EAF01_004255 [Botrytis porri]KAF7908500.1 hypothetical protein EAF01_004255 [Botrytis porri]